MDSNIWISQRALLNEVAICVAGRWWGWAPAVIVDREPVAVEVLIACRDAIVHAQIVRARPKGERRVAMRHA
eukprot:6011646-Pyramimonas_sp.AAC.1